MKIMSEELSADSAMGIIKADMINRERLCREQVIEACEKFRVQISPRTTIENGGIRQEITFIAQQ